MNTRLVLKYFQRASLLHSSKLSSRLKPQSLCSNFLNTLRYCSTFNCYEERDPAPLYFSEEVQTLLKKLTGLNLEKVFKRKYLENPDSQEEYKFFTKEELEEKMRLAQDTAKVLLQMPPVLQQRKPIKEILSFDPALQGLETSNIVVTDISFGVSDRERIIIVREPNGVLRKATWEERDRMNYIYNPRPGRYLKAPPLFQEEYLKDVLKREEYVFLLDLACAHFEPDDPKFYEVTSKTYEHVNSKRNFESLYSTRHFGPMCFYLAWNKKIDGLLEHNIQGERMEEAVDLIRVYYHINDSTKLSDIDKEDNIITVIKNFIKEEAKLKSSLESIVQNYEEAKRQKEEYEKKLKASHGLS